MKNLKWLLQSSGINFSQWQKLYESLKRQDFNVQEFGIISPKNLTNIENILEPNDYYIIRGGVRLLTILNDVKNISECNQFLSEVQLNNSNYYLNALKNGMDYDFEKFDQMYYKDLNLPLLNNDSKYIPYSEIKTSSFENDYFIKPSRDLKAFNGGILNSNETLLNYIMRTGYMKSIEDETIIISPIKKIYSEYRFFCLKDTIITGSRYKLNNTLDINSNIPEYILSAAKDYVKLYNPADIFVMDLCDTPYGVKIVEYNCWNCSGLYDVDISKLVHDISNFKGIK